MERVLERGIFPAIVLEDDVIANPDWWRITPPADWQVALLAGMVPPGSTPLHPVGRWSILPEGRWYGAMAYGLADAGVAALLRDCWRREEVIVDIAWSDVLVRVAVYAATPPAFQHDILLRSDILDGYYPGDGV